MTDTNKDRCLLGTIVANGEKERICQKAGSSACNDQCSFFIALHGRSGDNGRSGFSEQPFEYKYSTIQNSKVRDSQPEAYERLDLYDKSLVKIFDQTADPKSRVKNLYLWSAASGTGKSLTAASALNSFLVRYYLGALKRKIQPHPLPIYFLDLNQFQNDYLQMTRTGVPNDIREQAADRYYFAMGQAKKALMAVFDDVGTRSISEGLRGDVLAIINERMKNYRPSIFTSNLPLEELPALFGEYRLFDRIRDLAVVIPFKGESKRGLRK